MINKININKFLKNENEDRKLYNVAIKYAHRKLLEGSTQKLISHNLSVMAVFRSFNFLIFSVLF